MVFSRLALVYVVLLILFSQNAKAVIDPLTGSRVSVTATQTLLAAPPLPSMDSRETEVTVQAAYVTAKVSDDAFFGEGNFKGWAFGLGISSGARQRLGYFGILLVNNMKGEVKSTNEEMHLPTLD